MSHVKILYACGFFTLFYILQSILWPFILGMIMAAILHPLVMEAEKLRLSRSVSSILLLGTVYGILVGMILIILPAIHHHLFLALRQFSFATLEPSLMQFLYKFPFSTHSMEQLQVLMQTTLKDSMMHLTRMMTHIIGNSAFWANATFSMTFNYFLLPPIVAFYFLKDNARIMRQILRIIPQHHHTSVHAFWHEIDASFSSYTRGQAKICAILSIYYPLGFYCIGAEMALVIGPFVGLFTFIPYVGNLLGTSAIFLISGISSSWNSNIMLSIGVVYGLGQFIESFILIPYFMGKNGPHPLWIFFAFLLLAHVFGFVGIVLTLPLTSFATGLVRFMLKTYANPNNLHS